MEVAYWVGEAQKQEQAASQDDQVAVEDLSSSDRVVAAPLASDQNAAAGEPGTVALLQQTGPGPGPVA